ncbi:hypothetical protein ACFL11_01030 [Patescibacteria group bacterium]
MFVGKNFTFFAPGFVAQGGDISETGEAAGSSWHAIVGRAIRNHETVKEMREAAKRVTSQIV